MRIDNISFQKEQIELARQISKTTIEAINAELKLSSIEGKYGAALLFIPDIFCKLFDGFFKEVLNTSERTAIFKYIFDGISFSLKQEGIIEN